MKDFVPAIMRMWFAVLASSIAVAAVAAVAAQPAAAMHLQLRQEAVIAERFITVADIATVDASPEIAGVIKALHIGAAPRVGNVDQWTREDVEQLIRRRVPGFKSNLKWSGPRVVKVRVATRAVDSRALVDVARSKLQNALQKKFEKVDVTVLAVPAELDLPLGDVSFRPRDVDLKHFYARIPVWVDVHVNGAFYRSVVVPFSANVRQSVYVANRDIAEGALVTAADFDVRVEEVSAISDELMPVERLQEQTRLRKRLNNGQILTRTHLAPLGMVARGDSVKLILAEGGVVIEARAVAQEEGGLGQMVRVKPESSADAVLARVVALGVVRAGGR
ncbi:MAG: flagellar basal body P-ring formation protein FlgA [Burkholderiales bacterium]|nr:flagellar basal body P-ring formation protein FlgA [Burkholderiales bacterium]